MSVKAGRSGRGWSEVRAKPRGFFHFVQSSPGHPIGNAELHQRILPGWPSADRRSDTRWTRHQLTRLSFVDASGQGCSEAANSSPAGSNCRSQSPRSPVSPNTPSAARRTTPNPCRHAIARRGFPAPSAARRTTPNPCRHAIARRGFPATGCRERRGC